MKKLALFSLLSLSSLAFADVSFSLKEKLGVEVGALYLSQNSGGETLTVFPMANYKILSKERFHLNAQIGATAYKDDQTDDTFFIAAARVNPIYKVEGSKASLEGLFGLQYWDLESSIEVEIGGRVNYDIQEISKDYLSEFFAGAGVITVSETVNYVTLGVKKWF